MAEVSVSIGGKPYRLACDDGQENRLEALAKEFDDRLACVKGKLKSVPDNQAIIVAALDVLDDFDEARERWRDITPEGVAAEWAADRLDKASERLEKALAAGT